MMVVVTTIRHHHQGTRKAGVLLLLLLSLALLFWESNASIAATTTRRDGGASRLQQQPPHQQRRLPSSEQSIGQDQVQQGDRPSLQQADPPTMSPEEDATPAPRLVINPFVVTLQPVTSALSYQQAQGVRNAVETLLEAYFTESYVWPQGDTSVTYVGLTQIVDTRQVADDAVEVTMDGLMYFAQGSTAVPTEDELSLLIEEEALPENLLLQALSLFFPTTLERATVSTASTTTTDSPTVTPTATTTTAEPTPSSTDESTVESLPPVAAPSSTAAVTDGPVPSPTNLPASFVIPADTPEDEEGGSTNGGTDPPVFVSTNVVEGTSPATLDTNVDDDDDGDHADDTSSSSHRGALVGGAIGGLVALLVVVALLIRMKKNHAKPYKRKRSAAGATKGRSNSDRSSAVDDDEDYHNDEEQLVEVNVAKIIDFDDVVGPDDDDDDLDNGQDHHQQQRKTRDAWSWKPSAAAAAAASVEGASSSDDISPSKTSSTAEDTVEDVEVGLNSSPPPSPSEVAQSQIAKDQTEDVVAAASVSAPRPPPPSPSVPKAGGATAMSYLTSLLFHRTHPRSDLDNSQIPPDLKSMGSSAQDCDESFLYGDGVLSDIDDCGSIDPPLAAKYAIEYFDERTRQDYVVKKDMLESPDTSANCPGASVASTLLEPDRRPSPVGSEGNATTWSEEEEERRKNDFMIPNPYFRRPHNGATGTGPVVDRSSKCALEPTDSSAATLAQRVKNIEGNLVLPTSSSSSSSSPDGTKQGMVPKVQPTKSWWRTSNQEGNNDRQRQPQTSSSMMQPSKAASEAALAAAAAAVSAAGREDEDTSFGPASSDGWDPADSEMSSLGTLPNEEEMFKPTVENKTGQSFLQNSVRNESARAAQRPRTASRQPSPASNDVSTTGGNVTSNLRAGIYNGPSIISSKSKPSSSSSSSFFTLERLDAASVSSEESDVLKFVSEQDLS
jgi:hypothetical protein